MIYMALAAYNEERNIGDLLRNLDFTRQQNNLEMTCIIINDGSTDKTADVIRDINLGMKIQLFTQKNQDFLKALSLAMKEVIDVAGDDDICVTMDADNTHPTELLPLMAARVKSGYDCVIASRFEKGGTMIGVPRHREVLSWGAKWMMRILVGIRSVRDYSTAYRAYQVRLLRKAFKAFPEPLDGKGFSGVAAFLLRLESLGTRFAEVPLVLRYDLKQSVSQMNIGRSVAGYLDIIVGRYTGKYKPKHG
jgi:dolichol-phosphate mannosyltransferase